MFFFQTKKAAMVEPGNALPGRSAPIETAKVHFLTKAEIKADPAPGMAQAMFGMGCFWGVERMFWKIPGVALTMVGYAGGYTPNPTYQEVCTGRTGHNEVARITFDPQVIGYDDLLKVFWEGHDPTQGMRQGNDVGTQYRSGIYTYGSEQADAARASLATMTPRFEKAGHGAPTTEIIAAPTFYYAEGDHQQYLAKNPGGYCGLGGTGLTCPIGVSTDA